MVFDDLSNEKLIQEVKDGVGVIGGQARGLELQRRLNKDLCDSISLLDKNIQKQSKIEGKLTKAMYFLSGVAILLAVIQIVIAFNR